MQSIEMSLDEFEVVEPSSSSLRDLRSILVDETRKSAIERTRRAETTARALEAILKSAAKSDVAAAAPRSSNDMVSEDYRSRLVASTQEVGKLRSELSELHHQQQADSENIESLQFSLERLHTLVSDYRKAKDETDKQLMELADAVRSHCGDSSVSVEEVKRQLAIGTLVVKNPSSLEEEEDASVREELEAQLSNWAVWSEQVTAELSSKEEEALKFSAQLDAANKRIAEMKVEIEQLKNCSKEDEREREQLEKKIEEWAEWAEKVTKNLQERDEEIFRLETRLAELQGEKDAKREQLESGFDAERQSLQRAIAQETALVETLRGQLDAKEVESDQLRRDIELFESDKLEHLRSMEWLGATKKAEVDALKEQLSLQGKIDGEIELKNAEIEDLRQQLSLIESRKTAEVDALREQLYLQENFNQEVESKNAEIEDLRKQLSLIQSRTRAEVEVLREQLFASENLYQEREKQNEEISRLKEHLSVVQSTKDEEIEAFRYEISLLKDEREMKNAEISDLREQLSLIESSQTAEMNALRGQLSLQGTFNQEVELKNSEIGELREQLTLIESRKQAELDALREQIFASENLHQQIEEQNSEIARITEYLSAVQSTKDEEIEALREQLVSSKALFDENKKQDEEMMELRRKLAWMESTRSEDLHALGEQSEEISGLKQQLEELRISKRTEIEELTDQMSKLNQPVEEEVEENARLKEEVLDMEKKLSEWAVWADNVTAELKLRDESEASLIAELQQIKMDKEEKKEVHTNTQVEFYGMGMSDEETDGEVERMRAELVSAAEVVEQLQDQVAVLTSQVQASDDKLCELQILTDENELLKLQLESMLQSRSPPPEEQVLHLTSQLAVRDATIKALCHEGQNIKDPRKTFVEQDSSPFSAPEKLYIAQDSNTSPRQSLLVDPPSGDLENARSEIDALKEKIAQLITHQDAVEDARINAEESVTLLAAYRDEIDRLSKENAQLRVQNGAASPAGGWWGAGSSPASRARSAPSKQ